jgi:tRNA U34 5-carboxymethylaminomethyl modifying enzyme MnmG/GidA
MEAKVKRTTDNVENLIKELEKQYVDNKPDKKEIKPSKYDEGTGTFYVDEELAKTKMEKKKIPENFNYDDVPSLRIEARQKLKTYSPTSIGQASRISGVSPADVSVLLVYMEQMKYHEKESAE